MTRRRWFAENLLKELWRHLPLSAAVDGSVTTMTLMMLIRSGRRPGAWEGGGPRRLSTAAPSGRVARHPHAPIYSHPFVGYQLYHPHSAGGHAS